MWFLGAPCPSAQGLGVCAVDGTDLLPLGSGEDGDPGSCWWIPVWGLSGCQVLREP